MSAPETPVRPAPADAGLSQENEADVFSLDSDEPLKVCRLQDDDEPCESCQ